MTAFQPGEFLGRYRLERRLGAGAMGEVYLARDPHIGRPVAVKTLLLVGVDEAQIADRRERMMREARAAGCLLHPHVVTLFDAGYHDEHFFLAFEFVEGGDLSKRMASGPLPLGEALRFVRQAALGLGHAHVLGIVHRDIKPSNLMLDGDGTVKISDFGIAKMSGQGTELTVTGTVVGSPHYLSPEQVRDLALDGRSDVFSLGVVLYEMLTGGRPFEGETISTLIYKILDTDPPPMARLKAELEPRLTALVRRMLAKKREDRFPDMAAVVAELEKLEAELPPEVLAATALTATAPTDPTVALSSDGAGKPAKAAGASGGAVAGTALREPGKPSTGRPPRGEPAKGEPPAVEPSVPPPVPFAPPPPPDHGSGVGGAGTAGTDAAGSPAGASTGPVPPTPPPSGPGAGSVAGAAAATSAAAAGGTYEVPSLSTRSRGRRVAVLAALLAVVVAAALFFVLSGDDEEPVRSAATTAGEEVDDLGGAAWPPPRPQAGDEVEEAEQAGADGEAGGEGTATRRPPTGEAAGTPPSRRDPIPTERPTGGTTRGEVPARPSAERPAASDRGGGTGVTGAAATGSAPPNPDLDAAPARSAPTRTEPPRTEPARPAPSRERAAAGPTPDARLASGLSLTFEVMPPDAFVLVDGTVIGRAAEYGSRRGGSYELPSAGSHRVTLRRDGMEDYHVLVEASPSRSGATAVRARMQPLAAAEIPFHELEKHSVREAIALRVDPPNARVLVDDSPVGLARDYSGGRLRRGNWLELPLGQHRISLIAPGRKRVDLAVDVSSGAIDDRKRIDVTLPPLGNAP